MYTLYKFHFLNGISEINQLFDDILILWPAPVYIYIYIYDLSIICFSFFSSSHHCSYHYIGNWTGFVVFFFRFCSTFLYPTDGPCLKVCSEVKNVQVSLLHLEQLIAFVAINKKGVVGEDTFEDMKYLCFILWFAFIRLCEHWPSKICWHLCQT